MAIFSLSYFFKKFGKYLKISSTCKTHGLSISKSQKVELCRYSTGIVSGHSYSQLDDSYQTRGWPSGFSQAKMAFNALRKAARGMTRSGNRKSHRKMQPKSSRSSALGQAYILAVIAHRASEPHCQRDEVRQFQPRFNLAFGGLVNI